jgi:hypothetical protein
LCRRSSASTARAARAAVDQVWAQVGSSSPPRRSLVCLQPQRLGPNPRCGGGSGRSLPACELTVFRSFRPIPPAARTTHFGGAVDTQLVAADPRTASVGLACLARRALGEGKAGLNFLYPSETSNARSGRAFAIPVRRVEAHAGAVGEPVHLAKGPGALRLDLGPGPCARGASAVRRTRLAGTTPVYDRRSSTSASRSKAR